MRFEDEKIRESIINQNSGFAAKLIAKSQSDKMSVPPCSSKDVENMEYVIGLKLNQHPALAQELLLTGNLKIVEDVTKRNKPGNHRFWGAALIKDEWVGENVLGKIWMKYREQLKWNN